MTGGGFDGRPSFVTFTVKMTSFMTTCVTWSLHDPTSFELLPRHWRWPWRPTLSGLDREEAVTTRGRQDNLKREAALARWRLCDNKGVTHA